VAVVDDETINRLVRQTHYSYYQIKSYVERVAADEAAMIDNIREADMFSINLDILVR
jgi:hypothetical protein